MICNVQYKYCYEKNMQNIKNRVGWRSLEGAYLIGFALCSYSPILQVTYGFYNGFLGLQLWAFHCRLWLFADFCAALRFPDPQ